MGGRDKGLDFKETPKNLPGPSKHHAQTSIHASRITETAEHTASTTEARENA